ncbi:HTH-type transcriptional regulator mcbR [Escherichia coli]|nr:HTH-type transcriptional regulator mcbR [Escherichia coli]
MGQQTQRNRCWVLSLRPHGAPVSLRLVSVNALFVAPAQAFTVPEVGKRQLNEINRIRYELELMAVALAVENLTMQKNVALLCQQYSR